MNVITDLSDEPRAHLFYPRDFSRVRSQSLLTIPICSCRNNATYLMNNHFHTETVVYISDVIAIETNKQVSVCKNTGATVSSLQTPL